MTNLNFVNYRWAINKYISNSYIPPWGVVILHIGVGHSLTPMCKTTLQGTRRDITII